MITIGKYIGLKRSEKNITQKTLAEILHVSPSTISKWESGIVVPHKSFFPQIADALDISTAELHALVSEDKIDDTVTETTAYTKKRKRIKIILGVSIALLLIALCICKLFLSNSEDTIKINIVDEYFSEDYEYYGFTDIYHIIIEYEGTLTDEFIQTYKTTLRNQYSDKFNEASIIIARFYKGRFDFESNADPDVKLVILPQKGSNPVT